MWERKSPVSVQHMQEADNVGFVVDAVVQAPCGDVYRAVVCLVGEQRSFMDAALCDGLLVREQGCVRVSGGSHDGCL